MCGYTEDPRKIKIKINCVIKIFVQNILSCTNMYNKLAIVEKTLAVVGFLPLWLSQSLYRWIQPWQESIVRLRLCQLRRQHNAFCRQTNMRRKTQKHKQDEQNFSKSCWVNPEMFSFTILCLVILCAWGKLSVCYNTKHDSISMTPYTCNCPQ